jgi:putative SOS response-associated peptidase YedK
LKDGAPFALAGLWERWRNPQSGEKIESATIIVTDANELVAPLHDRMPVIIDPTDFDDWLDTSAGPEIVQSLLKSYPSEAMTAYPVSKHVNKPENDDPECIEPVTLEPAADE